MDTEEKGKYSEKSAVEILQRNGTTVQIEKIHVGEKVVNIKRILRTDWGIKLLGVVDYLVHHRDFVIVKEL